MSNNKPFRISGTGCALVDYLYKPVNFSDHEFARYISKQSGDGGLAPGKLVFTSEFEKFCGEKYIIIRELVTRKLDPVAINIGGPSIVSLIHAAQLLTGIDAEVFYYGAGSNDEAGNFILDKLRETPLKVGCYKIVSQNTPFTEVLSDPDYDNGNGERVFINNIGAAWQFRPEDLDDAFFKSEIVVFGGTALVPEIHNNLGDLLRKAKKHKALTVVNTVYDFISEKNDPSKPWKLGNSDRTYQFIDLLITDMEEALRLSGSENADDSVKFFRDAGVGAMIITHGANDLHYFADNEPFGIVPLSMLPVSERVRDELRRGKGVFGDTTGCGDNLAGGVLASIARQMINYQGQPVNLNLALALGIASGGYACFYHGGTFYEEFPGQKQKIIESYYWDYLRQTGIIEEA
ncbi:MAG: carbohydrate kinase family protein [Bacteroidota bacterium]|nr:carbohydrate kinase family protein [Bacteroidota bacterium]